MILVVSPSADTRRFVADTLTAAGFRIIEADDGHAGLERARSVRPDVALLDTDMATIDASTALREMRADPDLRSLPVLFLATNEAGDTPVFALAATPHVRLPCQPHELVARVGIALRVKEDNAAAQRANDGAVNSTDVLTGLPDRQCMETHILELAARYGPHAVVTVLTIVPDEFDSINDAHGVAVGDIVLRIAARRLQGAVADEPVILCRWDRCKFLVAGVGVDATQALFLAERLRHVISMYPFAIADGQSIPVTVSVGCASGYLATCAAVLRAAEDTCQEANNAGGDRVVVASLTANR